MASNNAAENLAPGGRGEPPEMRQRGARRRLLLAAGTVLLLDRLSKWWVIEALDLAHLGRIEVLPPWITFVVAWNTGINFGLLGGGPDFMRWLLVALAVAVSAALVIWVERRARAGGPRLGALALGSGILVGGALSNAWDRLQYGTVADFLNVTCCGIQNPWAFNIADIAVFAGAALIALRA